ncbi:protein kinase [Archangium lansingense]|uniref:Protein kinase n=1 Tax=Archangium lansingense TaxID=2995310 RepID=A0ABT4ANN0_9BACT|nr:protein kinase [Archangium lansinium]MCY1083275.1 protein kinase [Archangium lansinium]
MSDTPEWDGGKLGPYFVGKRHRGTGMGLGRLYQAHNSETGAPAVVLMPGHPGDWRPLGGWTVRATSEAVPPFLALEVEHAPREDPRALQELTMLLQRLGTAMARLEDRPDSYAHLTGQPRLPEPKHPAPRRRGLLTGAASFAMAAVAAAGVLLWPQPPEPTETKQSHALAEAAIKESFIFVDMEDGNLPVIGYPMPDGPIKGQRKPPCELPSVELRSGCWVQLAHKPPCPRSTAEHEGKCYMPVSEKKPEPRALLP